MRAVLKIFSTVFIFCYVKRFSKLNSKNMDFTARIQLSDCSDWKNDIDVMVSRYDEIVNFFFEGGGWGRGVGGGFCK